MGTKFNRKELEAEIERIENKIYFIDYQIEDLEDERDKLKDELFVKKEELKELDDLALFDDRVSPKIKFEHALKLMQENIRFNGQFQYKDFWGITDSYSAVLLKQKLDLKTLDDINSTTTIINAIDKFLALPRKEINATSFEIEDGYIIVDNSMFNLKRFKIIEALLNSKEETKYYIFDEQSTRKKLLFVTPNGIALVIEEKAILQ